MAKYWSPERQGFYDTDIFGESSLPEDCIYITDEDHAELMSQQCNGCVIVNGANNYPTAMQQTCQPCTCITHEEEVATDTRLGHVKIGDGITVAEDGTISADIPDEMIGATASTDGQAGIVPAPLAGDQAKYLNGAGEWVEISNATDEKAGLVKPDGETVTVDENGVISAASQRFIGETFFSVLPIESAGLHLLDGSLLPAGGIYDEFIDYIGKLHSSLGYKPKMGNGRYIKLPVFTSNTQDGITISDARGNTEILQGLFNGALGSGTSVGAWSTYWIDVDYNQATYLYKYQITADLNGEAEHPSAWTVQGTNDDGETWDVLDTQSGITFTLGERKEFAVSTDKHYSRYRIVFSDGVETSTAGGEMQSFFFWANKAEYVYTEGPFFTEEQWQNAVSEYGVCGKFVYTDEGVRLPKVTGFVEGTLDANALGDLVEAGLPNITGNAEYFSWSYVVNKSGALAKSDNGSGGGYGDSDRGGTRVNVVLDASLSDPAYGNSDTVQPQAIKGYLYMVVATATKTDIQVDIDQVATDLNAIRTEVANKVDISAADYVVETYSDNMNGTSGSWYRRYKSGYVECGGRCASSGSVTLPIPFTHSNYTVIVVALSDSTDSEYCYASRVRTVSVTGFTYYTNAKYGATWYACGQGVQS